MCDEALADPEIPLATPDEPAMDTVPADVRIAATMVAEAGQMLDTLTNLAARQREKLSAAERLLAELDAARAERA